MEEEIESTTGRLKYLSDRVAYSSLDVQLIKEKDFKFDPEKRDNFLERLKHSLSKGWLGLVDLFLFLVKIWPFWIFFTLLIWLLKRFKNRKNK